MATTTVSARSDAVVAVAAAGTPSTTHALGAQPLEMRDGTIAYPVFQFDARRPLPGVGEVVRALAASVATSWTTASWLTSPNADLGGRRPVDALREDGDVDVVVTVARRLARHLAG